MFLAVPTRSARIVVANLKLSYGPTIKLQKYMSQRANCDCFNSGIGLMLLNRLWLMTLGSKLLLYRSCGMPSGAEIRSLI